METKTQNNLIVALTCLAIIILIVILSSKSRVDNMDTPGWQACTEEAKICPDGSSVGRIGPDCRFAACPEVTTLDTSTWQTKTTSGTSFKYPSTIPTTYIHMVDWPPVVQVTSVPFVCTEVGTASLSAGRTTTHNIGGREYCVTEESEGAAGSIYTQYSYATPINDTVVTLTFSTRATQCGNYDEKEMDDCETERNTFTLDPYIGTIIESMTFF